MNTEKAAQNLGLNLEFLEAAIKRRTFSSEKHDGQEYLRLRHRTKHLEKGTVYFPEANETVRGFPKIRRVLCLKTGLEKHFTEFSAEEKMDGYNVRIAKIGTEIIALTRGGLVCPYSTFHANTKEVRDFLKENPTKVICAEFAGPLNPHVPHEYEGVDSIDFFAFDIREKNTNKPMPVKERIALLDKFGLKKARFYGIYTPKDYEKVKAILLELDKKGKEGLVLKDTNMSLQVKYTTANSTRGDLSYAFKYPFEFAVEFMFRRIIREGFAANEFKDTPEQLKERARKLGESILLPMAETIAQVSKGNKVFEENTVLDDESIGGLLASLEESGVKVDLEKADGKVKIKRHHPETNDRIKAYLAGDFCGE